MEPLGVEGGQHDPLGEIAGATILQYVLQSQPADIRGERRTTEIRKADIVSCVKLRPPVHVDIARLRLRFSVWIGRDKDEFFFEQLLDFQAGTTLWSVHDRNIHPTFDEPLHKFWLNSALGANGDFRSGLPH